MLKRGLITILVTLAFGLMVHERAAASSEDLKSPDRPEDASYACSTRLQLRHPGLCNSLGPASYMEEYARMGIYPEKPLPADVNDPALGYLPYNYLRVANSGVDVYGSLDDAIKSQNALRSLGRGTIFVSWIDRYDDGNHVIYQIAPGIHIRGDRVSRISLPNFLGLAFEETPRYPFGWIIRNVTSSVTPGYGQPLTSNNYLRTEVVQVYDNVKIGELDWYMIGPGEWIEQHNIAIVDPSLGKPEGVTVESWVSINLYEQTLAVYENGELVFATMVSSGLQGWWTRPGLFQVYKKVETTTMQGAFEADRSDFYYLEDVPYVLYFDEARALHGTYWHNNYGYQQSHGCVNLSPADSRWIYDWAEEGTWVYVWDPSGITPVDEDLYTPGGV
ncbi:MAG: L,D-transpeptidase family protein [Anaerolineales bacterium]|nr:L,D-transpeptidase family protein [Anaerolineales bacterium]